MASGLWRSSTSVNAAPFMFLGSQFLLSEKSSNQNKKPTVPGSLACGLRNSMIQLQLSPETPLARDGCRATRSVARAGTTHYLATGLHEAKGYFPGRHMSKGTSYKNQMHGIQKSNHWQPRTIRAWRLPELARSTWRS